MASDGMQIRTNVATQTAHRNAKQVSAAKTNAARRLASGFRVNSAADDPAGLAIIENMTAQIRGLDQASNNAQDGMSLVQVAEGSISIVTDSLHRVRELLVQAANDTYTHIDPGNPAHDDLTSNDRALIEKEIAQMLQSINTTARNANFNNMRLFDGTADPTRGGDEIGLQIGANSGQMMTFSIGEMSTEALGAQTSFDPAGTDLIDIILPIADKSGIHVTQLIRYVDEALDYATEVRAKLGSIQNRLEFTMSALDNTSINLVDSRSRIRDADMAREMMDFTQMNILFQAGMSMIAHGNRTPENVLRLLQQ